MCRFRRFVEDLELKDIFLQGRLFTWSNERDNPTMEKLDRMLATPDWELRFPNCQLHALASEMSDHCPLLLSTNAASRIKRRFHFENFWPKLPGYLGAVEERGSARRTCMILSSGLMRCYGTLLVSYRAGVAALLATSRSNS